MAGDSINHCNFTPEELNIGILRLKEGKWITESPEGFLASERTLNACRAISTSLPARNALKQIEMLLGV